MPIYGVSDRDSVDPRFKNIGKLRKGSPKNGGRMGKDLTYFRFTSLIPGAVKAFYDANGKEPKRLTIALPYRTMEENFMTARELYGQNGLCKERCDGINIVDWIDGDRHYHGQQPCTKEHLDTANRCPGCPLKQVGRLSVILPELWHAGYIGLVTVETHGWNDIANISGKLVGCEPLTGKRFKLWREDNKVGAPINGKRAAVTKSLVKIELDDAYLIAQLEASYQRTMADVVRIAIPETVDDEPPIEGDPYLNGQVEGDGFLEGETPAVVATEPEPPAPPSEPIAYIPMPEGTTNVDKLIKNALDKLAVLGYENPGQVCSTLANYDKAWRAVELPDLWQALQDAKQTEVA